MRTRLGWFTQRPSLRGTVSGSARRSTDDAGKRPRARAKLGVALVVALVAVLGLKAASFAGAAGLTFVVNSTVDAVDANPGDGLCRTSAGACTLRAATQEANAQPGPDVIQIQPGTYAITIPPLNENASNVGDFEIADSVIIEKGPGLLGDVIIEGGNPLPGSPPEQRGLDRIFEVHPGAGDVTLRNLILRNGFHPEEGGAIQNWSLGKLTLEGVTVKDSYASEAGGGLNNADLHDYAWTTEPPNLDLLPHGRVEIKGSTFTGNGSGGGSGGAINNVSGGTITISAGSVITLNPGPIMPNPLDPEEFMLVDPSDYPIAASAIANQSRWDGVGTIKIVNSVVSLNAAEGSGAGIANWGDSIVTVENSILTQNRSAAEGGGLYTDGGTVSVLDSTISKNQAANGGGLYSGGHPTAFGLRGAFTVRNSQLSENIAESGGGLYNGGEGQLTVTDSTFTKNRSTDHGAGISSSDRANMTLTRVQVVENESNGEGGGVWTASERLQSIADSTFTGNKAGVPIIEDDGVPSDDVAGGGGLNASGGPLNIVRLDVRRQQRHRRGRRHQHGQRRRRHDLRQSHHEQPRAGRRRHREQRHARHVRAADDLAQPGPGPRRRHLQHVERRVPHPRHHRPREQRHHGRRPRERAGQRPDRPRLPLPEQLGANRLHRGRRDRRGRRQGRRHHELRRRRLADREHDDLRQQGGGRRRRPLPRRGRRAPARPPDDLAQLGERAAARSASSSPTSCRRSRRRRMRRSSSRTRSSAAASRAAAATGTCGPRAGTSTRGRPASSPSPRRPPRTRSSSASAIAAATPSCGRSPTTAGRR